MAEWKDTYEAYVSHWQTESSEARSKSESTRLRIEAERAATAQSDAEKVKAEKQARAKEVEEKHKEEKLKRELEITGEGSRKRVKSESGTGKEERERKVREAWEMVKGAERNESQEEVTGDSRGVMDADIVAGQATLAGQHREEVHHVSVSGSVLLTLWSMITRTMGFMPQPQPQPQPQQRFRPGMLARHNKDVLVTLTHTVLTLVVGVRPHHVVRAHPALDARYLSLADLPHALGIPDSIPSFCDVPSLV
jgi:hypothetical protein